MQTRQLENLINILDDFLVILKQFSVKRNFENN